MQVKKPTPFAEFLNSPAEATEVSNAIHDMIMKSFGTDAARKALSTGRGEVRATQAEVRRRFNIIADWFKVLRGDMGWSMKRTIDELPKALRAQLDGGTYVPNTRALWAPGESL